MSYTCRICNNTNNNVTYTGREMYFGFRDEFIYFQCASCGCLQIATFPDNLSKYYPKEYGAYRLHEPVKENSLLRFLKRKKLQHSLGSKRNAIGALLNLFMPLGFVAFLKPAGIGLDAAILDVGTGHGSRLISLRKKGFTNLSGIEPFIENDIHYATGVSIYKKSLSEAQGQYDLVMLNHSFEHMPDPFEALRDVFRLLKNNRYALIRIPVADSFAWEKYRTNWMAMDPPRHFFLHTRKSLEIVASSAGFKITGAIYDSKDFQYAASEQLAKDIPLMDPHSYYVNRKSSIFSKKDLRGFSKMAIELNKTGKGDTACFYLYKA